MGPAFRSCPSGSLWGLAAFAAASVPPCLMPEPALGCAGHGLQDAFESLWEMPPAALLCPVLCSNCSCVFSLDQSGNFPCYGFFYFKRENPFSWVVSLPSSCPTAAASLPVPISWLSVPKVEEAGGATAALRDGKRQCWWWWG